MNFGSLFTGIGGFDLAFERAGMTCAWQVEIDDKCNQVLAHHWPDVPRYGDVRDVGKHNLEPIDVVCGGFPCQDLSVAGKRKGLAGKRSGLWFEFARIIEELAPRWVVIENVPGLLSSGERQDMGILLGQLAEFGYMGAYRVFDAQFFGVAQRRRRVFIVGSLGNGRAAKVLFESTSGAWNPAPSREAGARVTGTLAYSSTNNHYDASRDAYITAFDKSRGTVSGNITGPLRVNGGRSPGVNDGKADNQCVAYTIQTNDGGNHKRKDRPQGGMYVNEADAALTVGSSDQTVIAYQCHGNNVGPMGTLRSGNSGLTGGVPFVAWHENQQGELTPDSDGMAKALRAGASHSYQGMGVRRLTPVECERLQGFPDNWTAVNGMSDSARYRQLGNAVAVPVVEWIGRRIVEEGV